MADVTQILSQIEQGDARAAEELLLLVYAELRRLAAKKLANEKPGQTLGATGLVHEAYLRLFGCEGPGEREQQPWDSRGHFFAAAAEAMRRILIENARRKKRVKHGGDRQRITLLDEDLAIHDSPDELLALDAALTKLALEDSTAAQLVKLRVFTGLSIEQAAEVLGFSRATAYRHWNYARAWLRGGSTLSSNQWGPDVSGTYPLGYFIEDYGRRAQFRTDCRPRTIHLGANDIGGRGRISCIDDGVIAGGDQRRANAVV